MLARLHGPMQTREKVSKKNDYVQASCRRGFTLLFSSTPKISLMSVSVCIGLWKKETAVCFLLLAFLLLGKQNEMACRYYVYIVVQAHVKVHPINKGAHLHMFKIL